MMDGARRQINNTGRWWSSWLIDCLDATDHSAYYIHVENSITLSQGYAARAWDGL